MIGDDLRVLTLVRGGRIGWAGMWLRSGMPAFFPYRVLLDEFLAAGLVERVEPEQHARLTPAGVLRWAALTCDAHAPAPPSDTEHPLASSSEQFGLARPPDAALSQAEPSQARPWGLRGMHQPAFRPPARPAYTYCHDRQIAVDPVGQPLVMVDAATAHSVTDGDGDEGRSEDWTYDFAPDSPDVVAHAVA